MASYGVVCFGCRVNQADALALERDVRAAGLDPAAPESADVVVVNTCSVTASADQGARQVIRRLHRNNPRTRVIVTGCYATRAAGELAALPGVVAVVSNEEKGLIPRAVVRAARDARPEWTETTSDEGPCGARIEPGIAGRTAWTLRVQTGCDQPCAYCIIPVTRGRPRSRPLADVLAEVLVVADAGFKEVVITGVHLGSWGRDLSPPATLMTLLRGLADHVADVTFRISSLEPMDCTAAVRALIVSSRRFAPHFHLPLQHASDAMLRGMRRPYSLAYYADLVAFLAAALPEASIGSDVLIGFPGEQEDDHQRNVAWLAASPLTHLHVFPYSDRPGTAASSWPNKLHGAAIRDRARDVREIGAALTRRFRAAMHGTIRPGLTLDDGTLVVTDNYAKVRIAPGLPRNVRVRVRIDASGEAMTGVVVGSGRDQPPISDAMRWAGEASAPSTIS